MSQGRVYFIYQKDRGTERGKHKKNIFDLLVRSSSDWDWVSPNPGARNSIQASLWSVGGPRPPGRSQSHFPLLYQVHQQGAGWKVKQLQTLIWDPNNTESSLLSYTANIGLYSHFFNWISVFSSENSLAETMGSITEWYIRNHPGVGDFSAKSLLASTCIAGIPYGHCLKSWLLCFPSSFLYMSWGKQRRVA